MRFKIRQTIKIVAAMSFTVFWLWLAYVTVDRDPVLAMLYGIFMGLGLGLTWAFAWETFSIRRLGRMIGGILDE